MSKRTMLSVGAIATWSPHSTVQRDLKRAIAAKVLLINVWGICFTQSLAFHLPFTWQELGTAEIIISRNRLFYVHTVGVFRKRPKVSSIMIYCKNGKNNLIVQQFCLFHLLFGIEQLSILCSKSVQISDFFPQLENSYRWNSYCVICP